MSHRSHPSGKNLSRKPNVYKQIKVNFCLGSGSVSKGTPHPRVPRVPGPASCTAHVRVRARGLRLLFLGTGSFQALGSLPTNRADGGWVPYGAVAGKGEGRTSPPMPSPWVVCPTEAPRAPAQSCPCYREREPSTGLVSQPSLSQEGFPGSRQRHAKSSKMSQTQSGAAARRAPPRRPVGGEITLT